MSQRPFSMTGPRSAHALLLVCAWGLVSCAPMSPVKATFKTPLAPSALTDTGHGSGGGAPSGDPATPSTTGPSDPNAQPSSVPSDYPDEDDQSDRPLPGASGSVSAPADPVVPAPIELPPIFQLPTTPLDPGGLLSPPTPWLLPTVPFFTGAISKQANLSAVLASDENGQYFNPYILAAIDLIDSRSAGLGYDVNGALTQPVSFRGGPDLQPLRPPRTMCVAAQLEIILVAYNIYYETTKDLTPFTFLPRRSYTSLGPKDLRGHIWVNSDFHSNGTSDALANFGMGTRVPFSQLTPGSFININRKNGTGHAVTFVAYIDKDGNALASYDKNLVIGFRYYSSQGKYEKGQGGFGFRDAVFSENGCPSTLTQNKRDCGVIYSEKQSILTTGKMLAPVHWKSVDRDHQFGVSSYSGTSDSMDSAPTRINVTAPNTVFDAARFNGLTSDD